MPGIIDELFVALSLDASKFEKGSQQARESFKKTRTELEGEGKKIEETGNKAAESINALSRQVQGLFGLFLGGLGANAVKNFVEHITALNSAVGRAAENMGAAPRELNAWGNALERIGGNAQNAVSALSTLAERFQRLRIMGEPMPQEFYVLQGRGGKQIDISHGPDQMARDIAVDLQNIAAKEGRPAAVTLAHGMGLPDDLTTLMLEKGRNLPAFLAESGQNGANARDIEASKKLQDAWTKLGQTAEDLGRKLTTEFADPLIRFAKGLTDFINALKGPGFGAALVGDKAPKSNSWIEALTGNHTLPGGSAATTAQTARPPNWLIRRFRQAHGLDPQTGMDANGNPPGTGALSNTAPSFMTQGGSTLAERRARFRAELEANPALKERILAISLGENQDPTANRAVFESMINRADMMGTGLSKEGRTTGQGGYYAGYNPGALRNAKLRAMAEGNLEAVLSGSNVSDYATDNASGDFARRRLASGMYGQNSFFHGEYFTHPEGRNARGWNRYQSWKDSASGGGSPISVPSYWVGNYGAGFAAAQSRSTSNYSTSTSQMFLNGPISVQTQATDAHGFASDLRPALERSSYVNHANNGAQ